MKVQKDPPAAEAAFDKSMGYMPSARPPRDPIAAAFLSVDTSEDAMAFTSAFKDYGELSRFTEDGDNNGISGLKIKQQYTNNLFPKGKRVLSRIKNNIKVDPFKPSVEAGFNAMGARVSVTRDYRSKETSARVNKGNFELSSSTDPNREGGQTQIRFQKRF